MRILGITIPNDKRLEIGLTTIYGVGRVKAHEILEYAQVDPGAKPSDITEKEETVIREQIENMTVEGDLKRKVASNIKRLKDIHSYRGSRHSYGLPSRGQRTKTNSRTRRGNKRQTMGTGRRKVEKK